MTEAKELTDLEQTIKNLFASKTEFSVTHFEKDHNHSENQTLIIVSFVNDCNGDPYVLAPLLFGKEGDFIQ